MFKKFCALALTGLLIGCRSALISTNGGVYDSISEIEEEAFETPESFRVGVLLPLSGDAARYGNGLKKAMLMALEDMGNPNLILQFYDTQSFPEGAEAAAETAINQKAQMIIGPLIAENVQAVSDETRAAGVPVVAFSTNSDVLQSRVYTLGLLVEEQVSRIVDYAIARGRHNFALLVPDNSTGLAVARAAAASSATQPSLEQSQMLITSLYRISTIRHCMAAPPSLFFFQTMKEGLFHILQYPFHGERTQNFTSEWLPF